MSNKLNLQDEICREVRSFFSKVLDEIYYDEFTNPESYRNLVFELLLMTEKELADRLFNLFTSDKKDVIKNKILDCLDRLSYLDYEQENAFKKIITDFEYEYMIYFEEYYSDRLG